jgi:SHS2 domain-containing protein
MGGFTEVDHTADYALRVWGRDLRDLMESAGRGLIYLLVGENSPPAEEEREVAVEGPDRGVLVMRGARELLHLLEDAYAPVSVAVVDLDEPGLRARLRVGVVPAESVQDRLHVAIKAVTYHHLDIEEREGQLEMTLTFDT